MKLPWVPRSLAGQLENEIKFLRDLVSATQERNDRLVESLAAKNGAPLILPRPAVPLEPATGWWDNRPKAKSAGTKETV